MATFCSKCGAAISPGAQSCSSCGTAIAAAAVPAQPTYAPVPPVAAPQKSGSALKIILIVIGVLFALGILVVGIVGYMGYRAVHSLKVSSKGDQVSVSVPGGGSFSANTSENFNASDLGVDVYPGATSAKAGARMSTSSGSWVSAVYVTPDSQDKVVAFYKGKMGADASALETSDGAVLTQKKSETEAVVVTVTSNSSQYSGKTEIAIMHTKSTK